MRSEITVKNLKMLTMETKLITWINDKLNERDWSQRELARRAGLSHATISKVISGENKITFDFCHSIATAFNESPEMIFRLAGLLPPLPDNPDPVVQKLHHIIAALSPSQKTELLAYAEFRFLGRPYPDIKKPSDLLDFPEQAKALIFKETLDIVARMIYQLDDPEMFAKVNQRADDLAAKFKAAPPPEE